MKPSISAFAAFAVVVTLAPAYGAEQLVQVGSQSADKDGTGSICMLADSNAGFAGLKDLVASNLKLSSGKVSDIWVSWQIVAVEFTGATKDTVEAMMPADVQSQAGLRPCPSKAVGYIGSAAALGLGGGLLAIALNDNGKTLPPVGGLAPVNPPGLPPPPLTPPGLPGPPGVPGTPAVVVPVSPRL